MLSYSSLSVTCILLASSVLALCAQMVQFKANVFVPLTWFPLLSTSATRSLQTSKCHHVFLVKTVSFSMLRLNFFFFSECKKVKCACVQQASTCTSIGNTPAYFECLFFLKKKKKEKAKEKLRNLNSASILTSHLSQSQTTSASYKCGACPFKRTGFTPHSFRDVASLHFFHALL